MNKEKLLAKKIVNYSLKVKKDDRVLITYQNISSIKFVNTLPIAPLHPLIPSFII